MKATVLVDNISHNELDGEWGLSIYIEYNGHRILLDTGASDLYLKNADILGLPVEKVDCAVLSHAHYDHANGMDSFFRRNPTASFYLQPAVKANCYAQKADGLEYIGIPEGILEQYAHRIICPTGNYQLFEGVYLIPHKTANLQQQGIREGMFRKIGEELIVDDFAHEQSLVFDTDKGLVIFNSCSHGGAANIIAEIAAAFPEKRVYGMIGGFHLFNKTDCEIRELATKIRDTGITYICTGHCTMDHAYEILVEELGDIVHQLHVNLVMEF